MSLQSPLSQAVFLRKQFFRGIRALHLPAEIFNPQVES